ncbi:MAG TPA: N-acetyltransferase [bacterium]|nr:N-acetyltransferase [bacterium]HPN42520.1 N-acetyltransferase [bacterium]
MSKHTMQPTIRRLSGRSEAEYCARLMAASEPWITLRRNYEESLQHVTDPGKEVYCAVITDELAGFMILQMQGAFTGYIQTICIAPEWRRKGLGRQMIAFAERRIFKDKPNVFMCVSSFNPDALRLYNRLGYETIGELKDYIVAGHAEILLRKTIAPLNSFKPDAAQTPT